MNRATRVIGLVLIALAFVYSAFSQRPVTKLPNPLPDMGVHTIDDFYQDLRILLIKVITFNEETGVLEYKFEGDNLSIVGTFQVTKQTRAPDGIKKGKKYLVVYCIDLRHGTGANNRNKNLILVERIKKEPEKPKSG
jgi:hypothetical protein